MHKEFRRPSVAITPCWRLTCIHARTRTRTSESTHTNTSNATSAWAAFRREGRGTPCSLFAPPESMIISLEGTGACSVLERGRSQEPSEHPQPSPHHGLGESSEGGALPTFPLCRECHALSWSEKDLKCCTPDRILRRRYST